MKNCPRCAEAIQDEAKVCRFCGYEMKELAWQVLKILVGLAVLATVVEYCTTPSDQPASSADLPQPYSSERVAECRALIDDARKAGLIREVPSFNRINVEDAEWARFPAGSKNGVMQALGCSAYGHPLLVGEYAVAYSYRSGKRLAMVTSAGVNHE